jgi:hypothetical protein
MVRWRKEDESMKWLALVGMVALAGCGEPAPPPPSEAHVAFSKACVAAGDTEELCECRADKIDGLVADGSVSPEVQQAFLLQAQGKEDEADAIMMTLPPGDLLHQPSMLAKAQLECVAPN